MTVSKILKNSSYLLSALLIAACQPPSPTDEALTTEKSPTADTPVIIDNDSVTITPDHILSIKPSRYQPSLGLQGNIEPIKQTQFVTVHPINVEEILVTKGQWVEKGTPLLIVRRLAAESNTVNSSDISDDADSNSGKPDQEIKIQKDADTIDTKQTEAQDTSANAKPSQTTVNNDTTIKSTSSDGKKEPLMTDAAIVSSSDNEISISRGIESSKPKYNLITIRASFSGRVEGLYVKAGQKLEARMPLLKFSDETKLHFTAILPIQAEPQLSVGQTVNFTAENILEKFTGQISKLTTTSQPKRLMVNVDVIDNEVSRKQLLPNMKVTGRVNYGQIDVGTIVPKRALHDVDLTELQSPPYKPLVPLTANVWIIGQDQHLKRYPIEVVEYNPSTEQYLIAGISNDSLICLADLPLDSDGKKVNVS
ncbi:HlyD family efflux transporter periplasmic adaptor subunit [Psychrobacter sp. NZS113]|uniref:HlyD family efflux transporter periplasmic adaptor subunit n=1 Tax=Psychrobacter sp. NZS113 TaxID=2792045 RepID=UPI0018CE5643|nr:HlyD family efflux transporter periplasmic adaptor subunit [Psychrobacter sp. NZS113]MBH0097149.1 HlyD family efflux transporter periplasmic adaptor subunit [Psychrobacter sp. NZS113]